MNGTIAGAPNQINEFIDYLTSYEYFQDGVEIKYSYVNTQPFFRMRLQKKKEIITMGQSIANPIICKGIDVTPQEWNEILLNDPEVVVVDTRNDYEILIGKFKNAIDPNTKKFSEFPEYTLQNLDPSIHRKVAMYCTGGIRCEKASSYMLSQGFETVYQLKGGILKYLEDIPPEKSLFEGECYVFDHRTAVGHGLSPGESTLCRGCRHPLLPSDVSSPDFKEGVHCSYCLPTLTKERLLAVEERNRQMKLSAIHQKSHLGYQASKAHV
jgi:UPF0176 protein